MNRTTIFLFTISLLSCNSDNKTATVEEVNYNDTTTNIMTNQINIDSNSFWRHYVGEEYTVKCYKVIGKCSDINKNEKPKLYICVEIINKNGDAIQLYESSEKMRFDFYDSKEIIVPICYKLTGNDIESIRIFYAHDAFEKLAFNWSILPTEVLQKRQDKFLLEMNKLISELDSTKSDTISTKDGNN